MNINNLVSGVTKYGLKNARSFGSAMKNVVPMVGVDIGLRMLTGDRLGKAVADSARDAAIVAVAPVAFGMYAGATVVGALGSSYVKAGQAIEGRFNDRVRANTVPSFSYQDNYQAATMRQASIQAIQGSKLNARNALGNEASLMHRGYKKDRF